MSRQISSSRQGRYLEDLAVGDTAAFSKSVTEADILMYAGISGDTNPVHIDDEYAQSTPFKGRIAHGMLSAALISAVLGTRLPGPGCIYVSQSLKFKAPVKIGDTVVATAQVTDINSEKRRVTLATQCRVGETVVIDGEATVMVDRRPTA